MHNLLLITVALISLSVSAANETATPRVWGNFIETSIPGKLILFGGRRIGGAVSTVEIIDMNSRSVVISTYLPKLKEIYNVVRLPNQRYAFIGMGDTRYPAKENLIIVKTDENLMPIQICEVEDEPFIYGHEFEKALPGKPGHLILTAGDSIDQITKKIQGTKIWDFDVESCSFTKLKHAEQFKLKPFSFVYLPGNKVAFLSYSLSGDGKKYELGAFEFHQITAEVKAIGGPLEKRTGPQLVRTGRGDLLIVGGQLDNGALKYPMATFIEKLDESKGVWKKLPIVLPLDVESYTTNFVPVGVDQLIIRQGTNDKLISFDVITNKVSNLAKAPSVRGNAAVWMKHDAIVFCGGEIDHPWPGIDLKSCDVYDASSNSWQ
ncbi:MAG: hypothetical protein IPJ84_08340 [Bdellovibrionales bacterium]|nr:hypothetical protein [Bdellovibrionales bacterium]